MRVLVQKVKYAKCSVDNKITGSIDKGFLLFVGFTDTDTEAIMDKVIKKTLSLRIFEDENYKMNLSLNDVKGQLLIISQFTLYADIKHGARPSFTSAMKADRAQPFYNLFVEKVKAQGYSVSCGVFGADMKIELLNDGPCTIIVDSDNL